MRLYIAGPMTGLPDYNYPAFDAAAEKLRARGFEVVSPAEHDLPIDTPWAVFMRHGITQMMTCDAVAVLPGWRESKGADIEVDIATRLGMRCRRVERWLA